MNINATLLGGECPRLFFLSGRIGQTLHHLVNAKSQGITAHENPALRLAAYIHSLREMGFIIETKMEPHFGAYPGYHARYFLRSTVKIEKTHKGGAQ